jgi:hypothetical protein
MEPIRNQAYRGLFDIFQIHYVLPKAITFF